MKKIISLIFAKLKTKQGLAAFLILLISSVILFMFLGKKNELENKLIAVEASSSKAISSAISGDTSDYLIHIDELANLITYTTENRESLTAILDDMSQSRINDLHYEYNLPALSNIKDAFLCGIPLYETGAKLLDKMSDEEKTQLAKIHSNEIVQNVMAFGLISNSAYVYEQIYYRADSRQTNSSQAGAYASASAGYSIS